MIHKHGTVQYTYLGESGLYLKKNIFLFEDLEDHFNLYNSEDTEKMQHNNVDPDEIQNAAFHLGLHCLKSTRLGVGQMEFELRINLLHRKSRCFESQHIIKHLSVPVFKPLTVFIRNHLHVALNSGVFYEYMCKVFCLKTHNTCFGVVQV